MSVSVRQSQHEPMERRSIVTTEAEKSGRRCADATRVGKLMHDRQDTDVLRDAGAIDGATQGVELTENINVEPVAIVC
jgi:hypothetical protein